MTEAKFGMFLGIVILCGAAGAGLSIAGAIQGVPFLTMIAAIGLVVGISDFMFGFMRFGDCKE